MLHYGEAEKVIGARALVLAAAHARNPERFVNGVPRPQAPPTSVWINPPPETAAAA